MFTVRVNKHRDSVSVYYHIQRVYTSLLIDQPFYFMRRGASTSYINAPYLWKETQAKTMSEK